MTTAQYRLTSDLDLPLGHLQLGRRAYTACVRAGCHTVADVAETLRSGELTAETIGEKTAKEVESAIQIQSAVTDENGTADWAMFVEKRGFAKDRIAFTSIHLQRVSPTARIYGLGALHLKKACSGLEAAGITNIGQLLDAGQAGIGKLRNFGAAARKEVIETLPALSKSVFADGMIDWTAYAKERGFQIIPLTAAEAANGERLLSLLPEICKAIIPAEFDQRAWNIFQHRLLVPDSQRETLKDIGEVYGVTRERVRQIEELCLEALRRPLFEEDYRGLSFRLQPGIARLFIEAKEHFESLGVPAWRASRWLRELATTWKVREQSITLQHRLVIELFGYHRFSLEHDFLEPLIFEAAVPEREAKHLGSLTDGVHDVLAAQSTGLSAFRLAIALKKANAGAIDPDDVPMLIELCSSAEAIGDCHYRLRFESLRSRGEQAFRILLDHGSPMHHSDLLREINRRLPPTKRLETKEVLVGHLSKDPRIQPIGKTGKWTLADWGVETRSLIDLLEDVLTETGEAMHRDQLREKVLERRPGADASIDMLLSLTPQRFRKVGPRFYALTAWGDQAPDEALWGSDEVARFVEEFFKGRNGTADFKLLREAFVKATGLSDRSAQGILMFHPAVEVERPDARRRIARLRSNWRTFRRPPNVRQDRPSQADLIVEAARAKLATTPSGELQLIDIVRRIERETGIKRPNIYAAISQSDELETIAVDHTALKICRLRGHRQIAFPNLTQLRNPVWKAECERAVAKLTLEEVDLGLFILGRQFDQSLRQMLECARDNGGMIVLDGHLKTISSRIDWALGKDVFRDKATLNLLRVERNERGHEPPTADEQRAILKFAPFLATLYIDYLVMIENKIRDFGSGQI